MPGMVLYHPPFGPHWVETDTQECSVSYTISFIMNDVDDQLLIHKIIHYMRRVGVYQSKKAFQALRIEIKQTWVGFLG